MICNNCGQTTEGQFKFCPLCGAPQAPADNPPPYHDGQFYNTHLSNPTSHPLQPNQFNTHAYQQNNHSYSSPPHFNNNYQQQQAYSPYVYNNGYNPSAHNAQGVPYVIELIGKISRRVQINGIIWMVIGVLQEIIALINIILIIDTAYYIDLNFSHFIFPLFLAVIGALNIINSVSNIKFSNKIKLAPVGIVKRYEKIGPYIATLTYNLLFGGIFGVVGSIMDLVLRNFVMASEYQLQMIERDFYAVQQQK